MSATLLASLSSTLPPSTLDDVSRHLSETRQAVTRGYELSMATILNRLAYKTEDGSAMRNVVDTASRTPANVLSSDFSESIPTAANTSWMSNAQNFTGSLFGDRQQQVINGIGRESGLKPAAAAAIFGFGAQSVLERLGNRVRQEGMTASSLASLLQNERESFHNALPAGLHGVISSATPSSPVISQVIDNDPVVAQTVRKTGSFLPWLIALLLGLFVIGLLWHFLHRPPAPVVEAPVVTAPTPAPVPEPTATNLGNLIERPLPGGAVLNFPERGVEGRLLAFIQDPNARPDRTTWFDFDRLLFDTGSATLQPQSDQQLHNIAAILQAYPNVHLRIGGYTDNVGDAAANLKLSQERATNVMNELVQMGVSPDRLDAKGYGEDHPVADNSTDAGRAANRRISMLVTQK